MFAFSGEGADHARRFISRLQRLPRANPMGPIGMRSFNRRMLALIYCAAICSSTRLIFGDEAAAHPAELQNQFADKVRPFLTSYCVSCHGEKEPKAKLELGVYQTSKDVEQENAIWMTVLE